MPSTLLLYLNYPHPLQVIATAKFMMLITISALKGKGVGGARDGAATHR
jgi:hypothetical protein